VCGDIIREATAALEKAEAREVEEVMVRLMETTRDELIDLASKVEDQAEEAEPGLLIELGEEMSTGETTRQAWPGC
jgi:ABC-type iron transport system FetAB ATPase subunit